MPDRPKFLPADDLKRADDLRRQAADLPQWTVGARQRILRTPMFYRATMPRAAGYVSGRTPETQYVVLDPKVASAGTARHEMLHVFDTDYGIARPVEGRSRFRSVPQFISNFGTGPEATRARRMLADDPFRAYVNAYASPERVAQWNSVPPRDRIGMHPEYLRDVERTDPAHAYTMMALKEPWEVPTPFRQFFPQFRSETFSQRPRPPGPVHHYNWSDDLYFYPAYQPNVPGMSTRQVR